MKQLLMHFSNTLQNYKDLSLDFIFPKNLFLFWKVFIQFQTVISEVRNFLFGKSLWIDCFLSPPAEFYFSLSWNVS